MCVILAAALPYLAFAASAAGAGVSMYGQHQQGKAANEAAKYNARMKELQAESVAEQASFEQRERIKRHQQEVAKGIASAAGSGLSTDSGSVLDWEGDMIGALDNDLAAIDHNAKLQRFGLFSGAVLDRFGGKSARHASNIQMGATAFSTVGSIAGDWYQYKNT